ncbi:glycosyltransferase family 4 protein [Clostridium sp. HBUAS56017]|uniref:glycosyltransferase family 4 protein n=1 Tax=Clostridium sp. HBUAS56017 TaxID=2571128 RepID=UPI001177F611|nr:glycosyltransferase family 4 protein [Clostridium sp. HBUAS56017]
MRILYIATSFPKPEKGATIYTDLAEALHDAAHEITIVVSEQKRNKEKAGIKKERGFDVLRIVTGNYYDVGYVEKGITTLKMPLLMRRGIKKYLANKVFDFILFEAPPVTNAGLVDWAKKEFNCPSYLMLKDIFPDNAVDLGIIKRDSLLFRYFSAKAKKLFEVTDYVGCMSYANKQYVIKHNSWLDPKKVDIFPNTKKLIESIDLDGFPMRKKYKISEEACVFLFGGNMGRPQCVNLLCEAIRECKDDKGIFFLFVGRGTDRYKLEQIIQENNIRNALLIDSLPRNEYEKIIKECNVGLIVLDPRFTIPNYPSRILSYMEYAKPVLAATDKVTDIKELIKEAECGNWVWSGDSREFINTIRKMSKSDALTIMGSNGRKYIEDKFDVKNSVKILEKYFVKK